MIALSRSVLCLLHPRLNQSRTRGSETDIGWVDMESKEGPEWPRINIVPPLPLHNLAPVLSLNIREISNSEVVFFNVSGNTCDVARTWSVNLRCSCSYNLKTRLVSQHSTGHSIKPTMLFLACIRLNVTQKEQREKKISFPNVKVTVFGICPTAVKGQYHGK